MSLERNSEFSSPTTDIVFKRWLGSFPKVSLKDEPGKWTEDWERFLEAPRPPGLAQFYLRSRPAEIDNALISCYRGSYRDVCRLQLEVSRTAGNVSAHLDFDKTWLKWTSKERRDFLQEAIARGVGFNPENLEAIRPYCREVSIPFLEGSLLDVLKRCLLDDTSENPKSPLIYPIEFMKEIDETVLPPGRGLMLRYVRLRQTQLICSVLGQALIFFAGEDPIQNVPSLKGEFKLKDRPREERKAYKAMSAACEHCRKEEVDPKTQKMQVCAKCNSIGRRMPYCSRECVKADWPRHKLICGKPLTVENAIATAVPVVDPAVSRGQPCPIVAPFAAPIPSRASRVCSIRPVAGGYKRSPVLTRQVLLLQQYPAVDYFLFLPGFKDNLVPITLTDEAISARFCAERDTAMSTGDLESVGHIFVQLMSCSRPSIAAGLYREEYLTTQFKKEYGVDIS